MFGVFRIDKGKDFHKTGRFFDLLRNLQIRNTLKKFGEAGVSSLKANTPIDSSLTANSWDYTIESEKSKHTITWTNSNVNKGVPIAIILQYGHGTRFGGYVMGTDYINPAMKNIFDEMAEEAWEEVSKL